ncbi:uncharacterized protein EV420DRAFT_1277331, partial [Desarmillaria tabescens]
RPDYIESNMNFVEDTINHLFMWTNNIEVQTTFHNLKELLRLQDGWHSIFPDKDFTYSCTKNVQIQGSSKKAIRIYQSCINRIYMMN